MKNKFFRLTILCPLSFLIALAFSGCMVAGMAGHGGMMGHADQDKQPPLRTFEKESTNGEYTMRISASDAMVNEDVTYRLFVTKAETNEALDSARVVVESMTERTMHVHQHGEDVPNSRAPLGQEPKSGETKGELLFTRRYETAGDKEITFALIGVGSKTLEKPLRLKVAHSVADEHHGHSGGFPTTTMVVVGAITMGLMMAFSWARWF